MKQGDGNPGKSGHGRGTGGVREVGEARKGGRREF